MTAMAWMVGSSEKCGVENGRNIMVMAVQDNIVYARRACHENILGAGCVDAYQYGTDLEAGCSLPSRGSKNHHRAMCRPCAQVMTAGGCNKGESCNFCHFYHEEQQCLEARVHSAIARVRNAMKSALASHQHGDKQFMPTQTSNSNGLHPALVQSVIRDIGAERFADLLNEHLPAFYED